MFIQINSIERWGEDENESLSERSKFLFKLSVF